MSYWRSASLALPSARYAAISTRWALSRSGSPATAASPASAAAAKRPPRVSSLAQDLECVQAQLAEPLALEHDPVVVPVGQQVAFDTQRAPRVVVARAGAVDHGPRHRDGGVHVDADVGGQREVRSVGPHEPVVNAGDAPQRGAQRAVGARLARVGPQPAGHVVAAHRALLQREEGDQALGDQRQAQVALGVAAGESAEQVEPHGLRWGQGVCVLGHQMG